MREILIFALGINDNNVNPSATETLKSPVTQLLPPEIKPEDVVDPAGMEIKFDENKRVYYLTTMVELSPKEVRELQVQIRNVWYISDEVIAGIKEEVDQKVKALVGTQYEKTSRLLADKVIERIGAIEEEQRKDLGVKRRMELYRAHMSELESIRTEVLSLDAFRRLKGEEDAGVRTAKFVLRAKNPADEARDMTVRAELPQNIAVADVLDKQGFSMLYDEKKTRFVLEKVDRFNAKEEKTYEIVLKDIWYVPSEDLDFLKEQTEKLVELFKETSYEKYAQQNGDFILTALAAIRTAQDEVADTTNLQDKIRVFELNSQRMRLVRKKYQELQDLLTELPLKKREDALEKVKQAIKQVQRVTDLAKVLSMGFQPDLSTTWWIILGIVAFLAVLSLIFYLTWLKRLNQYVYDKKGDKETEEAKGKVA